MRKPDNLIDYEQLLKQDPNLEITTQGVKNWLEKFLPYTKETLMEINKSGVKKYPSIVQEYTKYVRELMDYEQKEYSLIDNRIKEILILQHNFSKIISLNFLRSIKILRGVFTKVCVIWVFFPQKQKY